MTDSTLKDIAEQLVKNCREGTSTEARDDYYAADAVSVEAMEMTGTDSRDAVGLDAIKGKHDWWNNMMELHSANVDGPYLHGDDRFGVIFEFDATDKSSGERSQMKELGVYTVKDSKIVREEFFYTM
jgi:hypothetical protein|tara:strand:- start:2153 stop:2533 length:381 start_codon:yes stop_codon:yes gene_type:complete